jgi:hypothetical protein
LDPTSFISKEVKEIEAAKRESIIHSVVKVGPIIQKFKG